MLSVNIRQIDDTGGEAVAHVQITRRKGDEYSYLWIIESSGEVIEGELNNFERSRGPLELLWQVLSLYMLNKENRQMVDEWFRGMISISEESE